MPKVAHVLTLSGTRCPGWSRAAPGPKQCHAPCPANTALSLLHVGRKEQHGPCRNGATSLTTATATRNKAADHLPHPLRHSGTGRGGRFGMALDDPLVADPCSTPLMSIVVHRAKFPLFIKVNRAVPQEPTITALSRAPRVYICKPTIAVN